MQRSRFPQLSKTIAPLALAATLWGGAASAGEPACKGMAEPDAKAPAASLVIDGKPVKLTVGELDASMSEMLCAARLSWQQQVYSLRADALDELIERRLLEAEAKRRKVASVKALIEAEMAATPAPKEAEIKGLYEEYKDRMEGAEYDEVKGEIGEFLHNQAKEAKVAALVASLKEKAKVQVALEPWRVDRGSLEKGPARGPEAAPITIVEFADYECPFCARGSEVIKQVQKKYPKQVRVIFRDYPLPFHPQAVPAAVAVRCAGKQGKYWEAHDAMFGLDAEISEEAITKTLADIKGLDMKSMATCQADAAIQAEVMADAEAGAAAGVEGTPAFFINGIPLSGAQPLDTFSEIIEQELARKK